MEEIKILKSFGLNIINHNTLNLELIKDLAKYDQNSVYNFLISTFNDLILTIINKYTNVEELDHIKPLLTYDLFPKIDGFTCRNEKMYISYISIHGFTTCIINNYNSSRAGYSSHEGYSNYCDLITSFEVYLKKKCDFDIKLDIDLNGNNTHKIIIPKNTKYFKHVFNIPLPTVYMMPYHFVLNNFTDLFKLIINGVYIKSDKREFIGDKFQKLLFGKNVWD